MVRKLFFGAGPGCVSFASSRVRVRQGFAQGRDAENVRSKVVGGYSDNLYFGQRIIFRCLASGHGFVRHSPIVRPSFVRRLSVVRPSFVRRSSVVRPSVQSAANATGPCALLLVGHPWRSRASGGQRFLVVLMACVFWRPSVSPYNKNKRRANGKI